MTFADPVGATGPDVTSGPTSVRLHKGAGHIGQNADQFLVEQIRAGDEEAWRQLIARYEGRLRAFARSRLPSAADADDAVQEAFLGFVQSLPHFDMSRSLETYLFAIVRYKIGDVCRRKRMPTPADFSAGEDDEWADFGDRPGPVETPSGVLRQKESLEQQRELIADGLKQLVRDYAEKNKFRDLQVVELSFYVGRRNKEIAEQLEVDEKHVAGVKFRAIARLRELIGARSEEAAVEELTDEAGVADIWRERRISCLKRSTLGAYLIGVLDAPWFSYTHFHLEVIGCPICAANLADLEAETHAQPDRQSRQEHLFVSSVGFLRTAHGSSP